MIDASTGEEGEIHEDQGLRQTLQPRLAGARRGGTPLLASLTPALKRVGEHLVSGITADEIAAVTAVSPLTVKKYLRDLRTSLHCPPRCAPPVLLHHLLASRQVEPPSVDRPVPDLSPKQLALVIAIAQHSARDAIALAAGITPAEVRPALATLLAKAGARDTRQLVVLAHAWQILPVSQNAVPEGRQSPSSERGARRTNTITPT